MKKIFGIIFFGLCLSLSGQNIQYITYNGYVDTIDYSYLKTNNLIDKQFSDTLKNNYKSMSGKKVKDQYKRVWGTSTYNKLVDEDYATINKNVVTHWKYTQSYNDLYDGNLLKIKLQMLIRTRSACENNIASLVGSTCMAIKNNQIICGVMGSCYSAVTNSAMLIKKDGTVVTVEYYSITLATANEISKYY